MRYNTRKHKSLKPLGIQTAWTENDIASAHDILDALRHKGKVVEKPEKDHHKGKAAHTPEKDRHKHKAAPAPKKDRHNNKAAHAPEKDRHQRKVVDKPEKGHHAHKMAGRLSGAVWESNCRVASPPLLNRDLHAIYATPARWRGVVVYYRSFQPARPLLAERGLGEELSGAPDTHFDLRTG